MKHSTLAIFLAMPVGLAPPAYAAAPVPCLIEPHRTIKLATPVPGVLARVLADRGQIVRRGAVVAELVSAVEEADLRGAMLRAADESAVRMKQARRDVTAIKLGRLRQLHGSAQFVSQAALDDADADAKVAEAELQAAQLALRLAANDVHLAQAKLELRRVIAPVDGVVTERSLSPGEYGFEQQTVMTMVELNPLNVELFLPVSAYGGLRVGQRIEVSPQAPIGGTYEGEVAVIDQVLDSRSGTFGVRVMLPNPELTLPAGIRCEATLSPLPQ